ncbi:hypothetical protein [Streptomyces antimicrobicus]|uniref:SLC26A/SulP transporter domain-containing protein n=1 Tax=Streptomyces antimicrobicus TaxID=2883108 RepID=A0ABS8BFZ7_9ACTN|nr:hypothetical protein [Streptomyces antimicrobicus]MCB5183466.1 hypothetical protein [Streptomyces antimicrobicus]
MTRTESAAPARNPRIEHVTAAGSALAVSLVPLVLGVLLAKAMAADPLTPVNALIAGGGQRARMAPTELRRRGGDAVRRLRATATSRRAA